MTQTAQMFARLTKVDEAKRQVTGVIASEDPDHANEVFDYETSKPYFEKWSNEMHKASGGKSVGNVRAMHSNVAAGGLSEIVFDDLAKTITVTADIVDDNEWNKVLKGVYTGFSIGGKYLKKWADAMNKSLKRYTGMPSEVSLVDVPCNGGCSFTMVKADGVETEVNFEDTEQGLLSKMLDPETNAEDRLVALTKYNGLMGVALAVATEESEEEGLTKSGYSIGELARLADSVRSFLCYDSCTYNMDGSTSLKAFGPDLKIAATALYDALLKLVAEDVEAAKLKIKELKKALDDDDMQKFAAVDDLAKFRESLDVEVLLATDIESLGKFVSSHEGVESLKKFVTDHEALVTQNAANEEELVKLRAEPVAAKGATRAVSKAEDGKLAKASGAMEEVVEIETDPMKLMKLAQSSPMKIAPSGSLAKVD